MLVPSWKADVASSAQPIHTRASQQRTPARIRFPSRPVWSHVDCQRGQSAGCLSTFLIPRFSSFYAPALFFTPHGLPTVHPEGSSHFKSKSKKEFHEKSKRSQGSILLEACLVPSLSDLSRWGFCAAILSCSSHARVSCFSLLSRFFYACIVALSSSMQPISQLLRDKKSSHP